MLIYDDVKIGDMCGGDISLNNHTPEQYYDINNGDVCSGFLLDSHNLSQCEDSSSLKNIYGDVVSGYGF